MSNNKLLHLEASVCISQAEEFKNSCSRFLEEVSVPDAAIDAVTIDISDVTKVDTAGLQLLSALVKALNKRDITPMWQGSSESLESYSNMLNLNEILCFVHGAEGSLQNAEGSLQKAEGSLQNAEGSLQNAEGSLHKAEGSHAS